MVTKSGTIYKLGESMINYYWHQRFVSLNESDQTLSYFLDEKGAKNRGILNLKNAFVSSVNSFLSKEFSILIQPNPPQGTIVYFAFDTYEIAIEWRNAIIKISHKIVNNEADELLISPRQDNAIFQGKLMKSSNIAFPSPNKSSRETLPIDKNRNQNQVIFPRIQTLPKDLQENLTRIQQILLNQEADFDPIQFESGLRISALKKDTKFERIKLNKLAYYFCFSIIIFFLAYMLVNFIFSILLSFYWILLIYILMISYKFNEIFALNSFYSMLCSCCTLPKASHIIAEFLNDPTKASLFDKNCISSELIEEGKEGRVYKNIFKLNLPFSLKGLLSERILHYTLNNAKDDNDIYYFSMKNIEHINHSNQKRIEISSLKEYFVVMPTSSQNQSLLYMISFINYGTSIPGIVADYLKKNRMKFPSLVRDYLFFKSIEDTAKLTLQLNQNQNFKNGRFLFPIKPFEGIKRKIYSLLNKRDTHDSKRNFTGNFSGNSIRTFGKSIPFEDRYYKYYVYHNRAVICKNLEELQYQKSILLEFVKNKLLFKSRDLASINLPPKILYPKSLFERLVSLWSTGPTYLSLASKESNKIERIKYVICFVVSGLHSTIIQKIPFFPSLGETYQGMWPDGTKIYFEHIQVNPHISYYNIFSSYFRMCGQLEYNCNYESWGNVFTCQLKGMQKLIFPDLDSICFTYPTLLISGIYSGERIIEFVGKSSFMYDKTTINASLEFPKFTSKFTSKNVYDFQDGIHGTINQKSNIISHISGSWIENLKFDNEMYWKLDKFDSIIPSPMQHPIPSDWSLREDIRFLSKENLAESQIKKLQLERQLSRDQQLRKKIFPKALK